VLVLVLVLVVEHLISFLLQTKTGRGALVRRNGVVPGRCCCPLPALRTL